ncbi:hypothetical protein ma341 [Moumouvirus australiensis]|uniref:Uncharacterized protein n=1 Tax=Moumouvirus australiensis TaxID=2109587 RepID=A0A2P1ELH3_9VIRU|nr:hypothetical protein QKC55_gp564 [Moumouvirus australiensis]AVL94727.1 hypothetical protein ma341 [Moumouvirus australiensis]
MIINIEPTLVYCFMFFTTVVITPVLYYIYRIVRDIIAYQGRHLLINQCARIFKENESFVKNMMYSFFEVTGSLERNIFDYFNKNQLYGSIGFVCDRLVDVLKTYIINSSSQNLNDFRFCPTIPITPVTPLTTTCPLYQDTYTRFTDIYDQAPLNNNTFCCSGCVPNNNTMTCNFVPSSLNCEQNTFSTFNKNTKRKNYRKNRSLKNKRVRFTSNQANTQTTSNYREPENTEQVDDIYSMIGNNYASLLKDLGLDNKYVENTEQVDDIYSMIGNKYASLIKDLGLDDKYVENLNNCIQTIRDNPDMEPQALMNQVFDTMLSDVYMNKTNNSTQSDGVVIEDCESDE